MNRHLLAVVISFSELTWIFLLIGGLLYADGQKKLAAVLTQQEKSDLALRQAQTSLATQNAQLQRQVDEISTITRERDTLLTEKNAIALAQEEAQQQLGASVSPGISQLKTENGRLQAESGRLRTESSRLQTENGRLQASANENRELATVLRSELQVKETELAAVQKEKERVEKLLVSAPTEPDDLQKRLDRTNAELAVLRARQSRDPNSQVVLNRDLIGLKGNTQRVVFVMDCSGSMGEGGRWPRAIEIMTTWIGCLGVRQTAMVAFNQDVKTYPPAAMGGTVSYLDIATPDDSGVKYLIQRLTNLTPEGRTNMLKALQTAFGYRKPDSIILFTDGAVTGSDRLLDFLRPTVQAQILQVCAEHPGVPVNIVGLGNYFDRNTGEFLLRLAQETGGAFIGR